jgi:hypothetical protein
MQYWTVKIELKALIHISEADFAFTCGQWYKTFYGRKLQLCKISLP